MQKATKIEAQGGEIVIRNSFDDVAIIPRNLVKKYQAYMKAGCDECIDELVASLPAMSQYAADGTVIPQGKTVTVTLPDGKKEELSTSSSKYKELYTTGHIANVVKDDNGEDMYIMPSLKEVEIVGKATGAARDMIDTRKNYSKEQYIKEKLPAFAGSLGVTAGNLGGNAEGYKRTINTKVAENILKRKPNAKEKDLTPYELEVINNSDLAYKIRANLGERFEQGILSVGNAGSPVEFKSPNLTPDQAKRENTPLNIFAPLEAGSKAVRKAIGDTDEPNFLKDIALDPLNLLGLGLIDDLPKLGKAAKALSKERQIAGSIESVTSKVDELAKGPIRQAGLIDFKGALQRYPKGEVTPTEVEAYTKFHKADAKYLLEDTNPVTKMLKDDMLNSYKKFMEAKYAQKEGKSTLLAEIAENQYKRSEERYKTHLQKNSEYYYDRVSKAFAKMHNRKDVNYTLYGGDNWNKTDYALTATGAAALGGATAITGLAISPPAVKRKALKSLGVSTPVPGALSSKDTIIDLTNKAMDYAKVNEVKSGNMILGGEFIESANNTVRTAKDWAKSMAADADTYSDKNYPTKNIKSFYGVEDGKLKVGKVEEFKEDTELVPRRFGEAQISKAVMNGKEMRILDVNDKPIYQNTPNTGKFILYSPTTKKSVFVYITEGKKGVAAINKFIAENGDAQYIHMDNGRYEYYGINEDGLSDQDFKTYYEQDLGRSGTPGYNLITK